MDKQANVSKRLMAYLLDILFIYLLISLITSIRFINPTYDKYVDAYTKYNEILEDYYNEDISIEEMNKISKDVVYNVTKYSISSNIVIILVIFGYFGLFQKFNNGQTLGKRIMKIKVVGINNENVSLFKYFIRILPMYYIFIGSVIPVAVNSIVIFILNSNYYSIVNTVIIYTFFALGIISFTMMNIRKDKKGLHDLLAGTRVELE